MRKVPTSTRRQVLLNVICGLAILLALSRATMGPLAQNVGALALTRGSGRAEFSQAQYWLQCASGWGYVRPSCRLLGIADALQGHAELAMMEWQRAGVPARYALAVVRSMVSRGQVQAALDLLDGVERDAILDLREWVYVGRIYESIGMFDKALESYRMALTCDSPGTTTAGYSDIYYRMGLVFQRYLESPKPNQALAAFRTAVRESDFEDEWAMVGSYIEIAALLRHSDPEGAVEDAQMAVSLKPEHVIAHTTLGLALYAAYGNLEMAERELYAAALIDPGSVWPWVHLGQVYYQAGDYERAIEAYSKALGIVPDQTEAKRMVPYLKSLRDQE